MGTIRLTRAQVRRIDRLALEHYRIPGVVLMENAARGAAEVAARMIDPGGSVLVLCGGGNNGGDGLAVARHLHNRGMQAAIFLTADPEKYAGEAKINWQIVTAMNLSVERGDADVIARQRPGLIVDAIFGTGLTQPPRDPFGDIVQAVRETSAPVLAIDIPSGLDCDSGLPLGPACIEAKRTVTFVAEKIGFANSPARRYLGEVVVADIGCPRELIEEVGVGTVSPSQPKQPI